ncbi:MAG: DUF262 domain-containing protein [Sphingomonas sp.]|uniref:DUF262 domain-containing protein n=1 Tax=Sphingomonas sp. TaxID=28214 RepID=UPI0035A8D9C2|nr:DUF262 domain-containing protein [Sphingomonas sp.]
MTEALAETYNASDDDVSKDDYELALEDGVEDDSLLEEAGARKFTINSYGADYTVDSLVKRMRAGAFKVPDFQRRFVWSAKHSSKFIESLLMGLPVPGVFLYKEAGTNEHLVIDGQQRLRTLQAFYDGVFGEKVFRLIGVREPWLGKTYNELDTSDQLKLDDSVVHATVFQQDQPQDVLDSIYFVFERINTGGIRLSPQEIRNCVNLGPLIKLAKELNTEPAWREVFGPPNNRAKDEELIVRFLALYSDGDRYYRPMVKFLNDFAAKANRLNSEELAKLGKTFLDTVEIVKDAIGNRAFRIVRALNAAVFDAVMVGIAKRLDKKKKVDPAKIATAYDELLKNAKFRTACEQSTALEDNVKTRRDLAIAAFADC